MRKEFRLTAINGVAKKATLGAMLFSSMALHASNPIKTTTVGTPIQTEVVSREGADALKANTFPGFQQNTTVPTVHNKKLDENFLKFCNTPEEKKMVTEFIDNIYKENGSYLGSATIQQNIDLNMFLEFLNGNIEILKRFDEEAYNKIDRGAMEQIVAKSGPIIEWLNAYYFSVYKQPFGQFDHMPTAEEVSTALDKYVNEDPYNLFDKQLVSDFYDFHNMIFKNQLEHSNNSKIQKDSDYIANQIFNADYLLFCNLLKSVGFDIKNSDKKIDNNLVEFLYVIKPTS